MNAAGFKAIRQRLWIAKNECNFSSFGLWLDKDSGWFQLFQQIFELAITPLE